MQRLIGSRCAQPLKGAVTVFAHGRPIDEAAMDDNANRDVRLKSLLEFRPIAGMLIRAATRSDAVTLEVTRSDTSTSRTLPTLTRADDPVVGATVGIAGCVKVG